MHHRLHDLQCAKTVVFSCRNAGLRWCDRIRSACPVRMMSSRLLPPASWACSYGVNSAQPLLPFWARDKAFTLFIKLLFIKQSVRNSSGKLMNTSQLLSIVNVFLFSQCFQTYIHFFVWLLGILNRQYIQLASSRQRTVSLFPLYRIPGGSSTH
jgi:hypothetical protein